jgi:hypothetical protein
LSNVQPRTSFAALIARFSHFDPQRTSTSLAGCKMHYLPADSSSGTGWTGTECYSIN